MKAVQIAVALVVGVLIGVALAPAISPLSAQQTGASGTSAGAKPPMKVITHENGSAAPKPLADVAVRIDRTENGRVMGTLVAKVNGQWVPLILSSFNTPAR